MGLMDQFKDAAKKADEAVKKGAKQAEDAINKKQNKDKPGDDTEAKADEGAGQQGGS
jgi:hypothetical protein